METETKEEVNVKARVVADIFTEKIKELRADETPVFVNGMGVGKIVKVHNDFISFEIIREEETTKKRKNKEKKMENYTVKTMFKELTYIPIAKIDTLSEGEKEIPKNEEQTKIDDDLGDL